ncbi:MAG: hypothetical protein EBU49_12905, partial [Proteobacteria bacterium]|nr:hypothetical protein [Pseudomonadota bacterium]
HHKVIIEISLTEKYSYKITRDAVSMHRLIREVKMVLQVIGWGPESEIKWAGKINLVGSVNTKQGSAKIEYQLPEFLTNEDRQRLYTQFNSQF